MNLQEIKQAYSEKKISKIEFIDKMHNKHIILNEYAEYIETTEIKKITIQNGKVYLTSNNDIIFRCNFIDKANVPLVNLSFGEYEKSEKSIIFGREGVINDCDIIFDIGANYGWYSLNIAGKFPNARVYAFEPIKYTFDLLSENVLINKFKNINILNIGFWRENTILEFNYNKDNSGATSMVNLLDRNDTEKIKCSLRTLDSFVIEEKIDKLDFIKCDVEGAEYLVLQGGKHIFEELCPILFIEMLRKWSAKFNYHPNDIINFMQVLGYLCFEIINGNLSRLISMTDDTISTNFIFLHIEKHNSIIEKFSIK